jgi:hypothetical protein
MYAVDTHNTRMFHARRQACLTQQPIFVNLLGGKMRMEHFECHPPFEAQIPRLIHGAHPARPNQTDNPMR